MKTLLLIIMLCPLLSQGQRTPPTYQDERARVYKNASDAAAVIAVGLSVVWYATSLEYHAPVEEKKNYRGMKYGGYAAMLTGVILEIGFLSKAARLNEKYPIKVSAQGTGLQATISF